MSRQHDTAPPHPDHSLYRDVYQRLRSEILAGRLPAGARLPSSRTLASQLGVARGTVEVAYQMLAGEGYTIAAGARGTMVNPALSLRRRTRPAAKPESRAQRLRFPPGQLLFQMGLPALDVFPRKQWSQIAARVCAVSISSSSRIPTTSWAMSRCGKPSRAICASRATSPARPTRS